MTEPILEALGIRTYILREPGDVKDLIRRTQILTLDYKRPVAILLTKDILGRRRPGE
jgi:sulfopyruvate decarboxylase TPP-binding subunit